MSRALAPAFAFALATAAGALASGDDAGRTVGVTGAAARSVHVDTLVLVLRLDTRSDTFAEARERAEPAFARIRDRAAALELPGLELHHDFDGLAQGRIKWGDGARRVKNRLALVTRGFEPERLRTIIVELVDFALGIDGLEVVEVRTSVSDEATEAARRELLAEAAADALANARALAAAAGARVDSPRALHWREQPSPIRAQALETLIPPKLEIPTPLPFRRWLSVEVSAVFELASE